MNATVRLDTDGCPYLVIQYRESEGNDTNAEQDAERIFFRRLNQNGATLHLVPGRDKLLKLLVVTGKIKRELSVTESSILGPIKPREEGQQGESYSIPDYKLKKDGPGIVEELKEFLDTEEVKHLAEELDRDGPWGNAGVERNEESKDSRTD